MASYPLSLPTWNTRDPCPSPGYTCSWYIPPYIQARFDPATCSTPSASRTSTQATKPAISNSHVPIWQEPRSKHHNHRQQTPSLLWTGGVGWNVMKHKFRDPSAPQGGNYSNRSALVRCKKYISCMSDITPTLRWTRESMSFMHNGGIPRI